ncbi:hypothetical protein B4U79_12284, partial [Dinothrombium tinctorium]
EINEIIRHLNNSAPGSDNLSSFFFKDTIDYVASIITHLTNESSRTGQFPDILKEGKIIQLPEISNAINFSELRPITILTVLEKILEEFVYKQLIDYLDEKNSH